MRVVIPLKELKSALGLVSKVVHDRSPKPVLSCVKISASDGGTTLEGTDLSCSAKVRMLGVQVDEPGCVLVPRARLLAVASKVAKADAGVLIASGSDAEQVDVEILMACHTFGTHKQDLFPSFVQPDLDATPHFDLDCGALQRALQRTVFAVDEQSTRYALSGVQLEVAPSPGSGLIVVATDGRRMAVADLPAMAGAALPSLPPTCVLPVALCKVVLGLLRDAGAGDRALLAVADGRCVVDVGGSVVAGRLVEGRFPRWRDVTEPGEVLASFLLPDGVSALAATVKAAAIATDADSVGVVLEFDGGGKLLAWGASSSGGTGVVDLPVPHVGARLRLTLAPDVALPCLAAFPEGAPVTVFLQGDGNHGLADGPLRLETAGLTVVVMPMADARPSRLPAPATAEVA